MWGTQGWNQWALQPSMFQNVPHEEIDWAALAKQWIQMQHVPSADSGGSVPVALHAPPPPPPPPPPAIVPGDFQNDVPVPPPFSKPPLLEDPYNRIVASDINRSPLPVTEAGDTSYQVRQSDGAYWTNQEWERSAAHDIDERLWNPPPLDPMAPGQMSKETFDYGHLPDNPPLQMHTVDYNHVSDQFAFNQVYTPENQYDVYWSQVGAAAAAAVPATVAPTFLKKDRLGGSTQAEEDISHLDAAKRKQLPAWIREGLEKMEQERLKRLEKERAEKEKTEKMKMKKKSEESSTKGLNLLHSGEYDKSPPTMPLKSKFDSDSEGEDEIEEQNLPAEEAPASPIEDHRTEEEKYQELMLKVRRMLTEILLDVTNAEMLAIAKEVYQKARLKAPARQLAMPSALPAVATGLRGLASYGSHSDESESEDEEADGNTDSDEELYRKIREKQKSFAIKEKKIIAELDREEAELREKRLAKAKAETQPLNHAEKKVEAPVEPVSSTKSNTENEEAVINSEINNTSPVSRATVRIPFLTDDDEEEPSPSVEEVSPESSVVQAADSAEDNSPDDEGNGENQANVAEDSEDNPEELENSSALNGSDSEGNNSGKQNDNEAEIQVVENHSEENEVVVVKDTLSKKSPSEATKKGNGRKTKSSSRSEKPRTKKKRSRSKGSDSSGNKNSRTSSHKRSKHKRRSSKSSHHKKRESSTASSSSGSSSSSSISTSSSSYRSTSGSKERHKTRRDSRSHSDMRRSDSYERHRTSRRNSSRSRKRSRSRSLTRSGHGHRRSTSRSSYHNSSKVKHWDSYTSESRRAVPKSERHYSSRSRSRSPDSYRKVRKDYRRSRSRSRSRTPKKYKKRSRSLSSESESSYKRFSARRRYR